MSSHIDQHLQTQPALTGHEIVIFFIFVFGFMFVMWLYLIPTRIARRRNHAMAGSIFLVNLLFGFTVVGWIVCLFWANSSDVKKPKDFEE